MAKTSDYSGFAGSIVPSGGPAVSTPRGGALTARKIAGPQGVMGPTPNHDVVPTPDAVLDPHVTAPEDAGTQFLHSPFAQYLAQSGTTAGAGDYLGQFQSSIAAARGNIQQQLAAALGDIAANQASASRQLSTLPGQVNAAYGETNAGIGNATGAISGALAANGIRAPHYASPAGYGANAGMAADQVPEQLAINASKSADLANVPLLAEGITQQGNTMQDQARMAALGDQANLDQVAAQGALTAGSAAAQANQAAAQQKNQFLQSIFLNQQQNDAAARLASLQGKTTNPLASTPAGGTYAKFGLTQADVQSAHGNTNYSGIVKDVLNGKFSAGNLAQKLRSDPALLNTIQAEYGNYLK